MGKGIKTRSVADKTIKAIDKAAVASERMKEAYIRTKYKGEHAVNFLRKSGKVVFIITHDLEFISLTASRTLLLKEGIIKDDLQMTGKSTFKIVKDFMMKGGE